MKSRICILPVNLTNPNYGRCPEPPNLAIQTKICSANLENESGVVYHCKANNFIER